METGRRGLKVVSRSCQLSYLRIINIIVIPKVLLMYFSKISILPVLFLHFETVTSYKFFRVISYKLPLQVLQRTSDCRDYTELVIYTPLGHTLYVVSKRRLVIIFFSYSIFTFYARCSSIFYICIQVLD